MVQDHDHRKLAQRLDLFHFQEEAPGMVFWHPRGLCLYRLLEDAARAQLVAHGYAEVKTPQLIRRPIWEASGHWEHFQAGMFRVRDEAWDAGIKPVSCPGHIQIVDRRPPSYRELPIRLSEFGVVHRDEPSGTLHGLMRLRQFTQDDGHVFCSEDQAEAEVERFCRAVGPFYARFGFEHLTVALSTRPADRAGDDREWDRAEAALEAVLRRIGEPFQLQPVAGAFYGPKLEFSLEDRAGRAWQCGTIQYDLVMPRRFDLRYIDNAGERQPLMMLHRALYGSLERFLGILLEHHGALLPAWLAPVQVAILPVAAEHAAWAEQVKQRLQAAGLRVRQGEPSESLGRRVAEAHRDGVPLLAVIGTREVEAGSVMLRDQAGQRALKLDVAVEWLMERVAGGACGERTARQQ